MPLKTIYLSLGSNLGNREQNLARALDALEEEQIRVLAKSSIYETQPQDVTEQPWFLNLVVCCETRCFPLQLLSILQKIERDLGRVRSARRGPRIIDIDILLYAEMVMETDQLTIPHGRMFERRFVLEPLLEIAPDLRHPATNEPVSKLLRNIKNQRVRRCGAPV